MEVRFCCRNLSDSRVVHEDVHKTSAFSWTLLPDRKIPPHHAPGPLTPAHPLLLVLMWLETPVSPGKTPPGYQPVAFRAKIPPSAH